MGGSYALAVANRGGAVAWVVPTYRNARAPWRFVEAQSAPVVRRLRINRTERVMEFPGGGRLSVYSADNDVGLRGEAFDVVIVDEAAMIREETYTDVLIPTLADRDGRMLLISTPKGRNWFYREWLRGHHGMPGYAAFHAPSNANPLATIRRAAELARDRVSDRTYRQEWLAEFVDDGGGVFRSVRAAATAVRREGGQGCVIGVDWGRTTDATVISVIDPATGHQVYLDRFTDTAYAIQLSRLQAVYKRFPDALVIAEANSMGGPLVEELAARDIAVQPFMTTNASKAQLIDALALAFERGDIAILDDAIQIAELEAYETIRLPSGLLRYSAPGGMHDDCVMALALAWLGARHDVGVRWL